jgi:hypothetical protein
LRSQADIEIVGRVADPIDLLLRVGETDADVVVHLSERASEARQLCTHLFPQYPELAVIEMSNDGERGISCRQAVVSTSFSTDSLSDLLETVRGTALETA